MMISTWRLTTVALATLLPLLLAAGLASAQPGWTEPSVPTEDVPPALAEAMEQYIRDNLEPPYSGIACEMPDPEEAFGWCWTVRELTDSKARVAIARYASSGLPAPPEMYFDRNTDGSWSPGAEAPEPPAVGNGLASSSGNGAWFAGGAATLFIVTILGGTLAIQRRRAR